MKKIENTIMLITYADSMSKNLKELDEILDKQFPGCIGGLHILPFYPSSGDRGFAVINYDSVDPAFGDWDDIDRLADKYYMMADFMLNHISPLQERTAKRFIFGILFLKNRSISIPMQRRHKTTMQEI